MVLVNEDRTTQLQPFKPALSDSTCLRGLFDCLHMEYLPTIKVCKFYFWFYLIGYSGVSLSILLPSDKPQTQFFTLLFFQFLFLVTSLFRPYKDMLESVKNIADNALFFLAVLFEFIIYSMV